MTTTIHVLAVDDEPDICSLTKNFLERSSIMEVDAVFSVREAMAELAKKHYDVIVSDYWMPGEDGIQFLKSLRAAGDGTPFILFTGKGREEVVIEALNNGADSYLQKGGKSVPQYAELEHRIKIVVQRHHGVEALLNSERRFEDFFEATKSCAAIYEVRNDGMSGADYIVRDFNRKALEIEGKTKDEVIGRSLLDLRPNIDAYGLIPTFRHVWQTGESAFFPSKAYVDKHFSNWYENTVFRLPSGEIVAIYDDVTDRKSAEDALKESQSRFEQLAEHGGTVIWETDADGLFTYASRMSETVWGYRPDELVGKRHFYDLTPEAERESFKVMALGVFKSKEKFIGIENQVMTKDGRITWASASGLPMLNADETLRGYQGSSIDITERRLANEKLRAAEEKFRATIEQSSDGIVITDQDYRIIEWSASQTQIFGYTREEMLGQFIWEFQFATLPEEQRTPAFLDRMKKGMRDYPTHPERPSTQSVEYEVRSKDGRHKVVQLSIFPVLTSGERMYCAITRDITERKRVEYELQQSEKRYRRLIESAAEAIIVAQDGMLRLVNPMAVSMVGLTEQELLSTSFPSLIHPNDRAMVVESHQRRLKGETLPARYAFRLIAKDGAIKWVEINAVEIDWEGRPATLNFLTDITEKKSIEEALSTSQKFIEGIINTLPVRVFWKDKNLVYLGCNVIFAHDAGFDDPKDVIGKDDYQMVWRDQADSYRADDLHVIESGSPRLLIEEPQKSPNGNIIHLLTSKIPMRNAKGEIIGVVGTYMDITERKRAEEAVQASKKILSDIIDFLPDPTFVVDLEGKVVTWNRAIERMTGVRKEDMIGQGDQAYSIPFYGIRRKMLMDRLPSDDAAIIERNDGAVKGERVLFGEAFCNALNNGKGAYVRAAATQLYDDRGNRIGAIESIRDVTERRMKDHQITEQLKELQLFYGLAEIAQRERITLDELYQEIVNILPNSWQHSEIACARIVIGRSEFRTKNFINSEWKQSAALKVKGVEVGRIEVGYLEEMAKQDEGPFLKEERRILEVISERIGHITERKQVEEALKESESRFEQLADQSGTIIWEVDPNGLFTYVGKNAEVIWGYRPDELVGKKHFYDLTPEADREALKTMALAMFERNERFVGLENATMRKDGYIAIVATNGIPLLNSDGTLRGYQGSDTDITERKNAEEFLKKNEKKFRSLFENMLDGLAYCKMLFNDDGIPVDFVYYDVNDAFVALTGLKDVVGKKGTETIPGINESSPELFETYGRVALSGKSEVFDFNSKPLKKWFHISVFSPEKGYFVAVFEDITERKRAEEALHQANNKLSILNAVTRHDINNQMMVLNGLLELSKLRNKDSDLAPYFEKMFLAAGNLQAQIAFTKNYQELGIKAPAWSSVSKRIAEAFAMLNPPGVVLEDRTDDLEVLTDPLADKVQYNLVDNSMRHGGRITRIRMSAEQVGDAMLVVYEDDGVGIGVEDRKNLFKKGFGKNTGYGLFLIREILAITGITIIENGQAGKGVRFEMLVPPGAWRRVPGQKSSIVQ